MMPSITWLSGSTSRTSERTPRQAARVMSDHKADAALQAAAPRRVRRHAMGDHGAVAVSG
jgi:hypothetical protein